MPENEFTIINKLEKMEKKVEERMDRIEAAIGLIAVQEERITNITTQVNTLWSKYDSAFGPEGVISEVKHWQASCPRDNIKDAINVQWTVMRNAVHQQWVVLGLMSTVMIGIILTMIKVTG
jgi:uncharacterized membrane protein